jgi:alpha-D-xyloside xylohydrolase
MIFIAANLVLGARMAGRARFAVALAWGMLLCAGGVAAQDVAPEELPGATRVVRPPELPVQELAKRDRETVALTLPGRAAAATAAAAASGAELLVHDFEFNGEPVATDKVHLRQVAPGVVEITSLAYAVGYWRFQVRDAASYFGLGERFDTLDHAHTVVKNL